MSDAKSKEASKKEAAAEGAAPAEGAKKKGGLPIKTIAAVAVIMVLEAVALVVVLGMGSPKETKADEDHVLVHDDSEEIEEIEILGGDGNATFQNMQTGQVWVWGVSIYAQIKKKNAEYVEGVLESRSAEIREGISQIIGRAQHTQLKEPDRQTLNRQISALLDKIIKPDEDGKPRIERLLIPKCTGYPADF